MTRVIVALATNRGVREAIYRHQHWLVPSQIPTMIWLTSVPDMHNTVRDLLDVEDRRVEGSFAQCSSSIWKTLILLIMQFRFYRSRLTESYVGSNPRNPYRLIGPKGKKILASGSLLIHHIKLGLGRTFRSPHRFTAFQVWRQKS